MPKTRPRTAKASERRRAATCAHNPIAVKLNAGAAPPSRDGDGIQDHIDAAGHADERKLLRAGLEAAGTRQAETAAMLIAVARTLLDLSGGDFAVWLRAIADDFEAMDPDQDDREDQATTPRRAMQDGDDGDGRPQGGHTLQSPSGAGADLSGAPSPSARRRRQAH